MKINFDNQSLVRLQNATTAYNTDTLSNIKGIGSFCAISKTNEDNNTYEGARWSINDFKDSLKAVDVQATQDYMTVMSNCLSEEDFNELIKEGGEIGSVEVKDTVTIMDKIKLYVAKSGQDIKGFTDTLDKETIKELTGLEQISTAASQEDITLDEETCEEIGEAVSELKEVTKITDGIKKFLLGQNKDLTIDNLYLAKHSSLSDTKTQGSDYFSIEAKGYLVKKGEANTGDALNKEIENLLTNIDCEVNEETVSESIWLIENSVPVTKENIEKLSLINSVSLPLSDEKTSKIIAAAISEGKSAKEADLTKEESVYKLAVNLTREFEKVLNSGFVKETRILEETRLRMTAEANLLLLKSDVYINTKDLEDYVEKLKEIESTDEYKGISEIVKTKEAIETVKTLPAAILKPLSVKIDTVSLDEIIVTGMPVKERLKKAEIAYEEMYTEVRKDLGDSIKKAFRNVPEILASLGMEASEENEKAVRILGYNSTEITKENIDEIKEADRKLQRVITRLTPADTLSLIRKGSSPINMSIKELNEYLDEKTETDKEEIEKYSKFLYRLERTEEISESERKDYIEVYRFFHQLEKTEDAAVGAVLIQGRDLTMKDLKVAAKTVKYKGMDVTVGEVYDTLVTETDDEISRAYNAAKYKEMLEALKAPEETVTELIESNVPISVENLEAALLLRKERGKAFKTAINVNKGASKEKALSVLDSFEDKESTQEKYCDTIVDCKESVYKESLNQDTFIDVRALQLVHRQLSVALGYSECENYEVPMEIGGQVTSVNVKLVHNSHEDSNVVISMETEELGRISARLYVTENNEITGYIACNLKETVSKMQKVADKLSDRISVVLSENFDTPLSLSRIPMRENSEEISSKELYETAKKFLKELKG